MNKLTMTMAALAATLMVPAVASAGVIFGFNRITNNGGAAGVDSQLSVEVIDEGPGQVRFTFANSGPLASSITDVYFDDGTLLGFAAIVNGPGVNFSSGASPGNLPGGNAVDFNASVGMTADSDAPVQPNGVNPGETLSIIINLINGQTYADTLAAMALSLASPGIDVYGGLRIGIHVQGFSNGQSESYVNGGPPRTQVPEPGSLALLGLGLAALGATLRRRRVA